MTDERSIKALDVAEAFANGEATEEELTAASDAARDAARAAARAEQCKIIRSFITWEEVEGYLK